jgi:DNA polymerase/3'-5' exonuclease PolX
MTLPQAHRYALTVVAWLGPTCERIEVAGSLRRLRPVVNDIDLVVIPKTIPVPDLIGGLASTRNLCWEALMTYARDHASRVTILTGGQTPGDLVSMVSPKCQLDVFFAVPETWITRLICRTGSKEHNIYMADRANEKCYHWNPSKGLYHLGRSGEAGLADAIPLTTEADFYAHLGLREIAPQHRELGYLRKVVDSVLP